MEEKSIGKFIKQLRREKNLSQKELGDIIGVSSKTISKWECGNGMPDITLLDKLSKSLDINIEELLTCRKQEHTRKKKIPYLNIFFSLIIIFILVIIISKVYKTNKNDNICTIIRTYYIDSIGKSNDENYLYITIHEFQVEGTYTIKLPKIVSKDLEVGKSYEFTFEANKEYVNIPTDILFENSNIINVVNTNKEGLERTRTYTCHKEDL